MKKIMYLIMIASFSCKAQITPLFNAEPYMPEGTHYKDLDNDLNKFEGTWIWQRNDSIVTITLRKNEDVYSNEENQYEDYLEGEYKFTVNGIIIQDYLQRLQDNTIEGLEHYLSGNYILDNQSLPKCDNCTIGERRIMLFFTDPQFDYIPSGMLIRHKTVNNQEQLNILLKSIGTYLLPYTNAPNQNRIPFGRYIFIKQ